MPKSPIAVVAALLEKRPLAENESGSSETKVFLARRSIEAGHGGLWELPGGKVEPGESEEDALRRELLEELGVVIAIEGPPRRYEIEFGGKRFEFAVFPSRFIAEDKAEFSLAAHDAWGYFTANEVAELRLAPLDGPALKEWAEGRPI